MSNVKRVYVEKKPEFAVAAKGLRHDDALPISMVCSQSRR